MENNGQAIAMLEARTRRVGEQMRRRQKRVVNKEFTQIYAMLSMIFDTATGSVTSTVIPPLEGDVEGALTDTSVVRIDGRDISTTPPNDGDVYIWDDTLSEWVPGPMTGGGGGSGHQIAEEGGTPLTARAILNFIGSLVTATDDAGNNRTNITITDPVPAHEAAANPHPTYTTDAEVSTLIAAALGAYIAKALIDAKGDLLVGTADNTVARLPVGANGTVPIADSTQAAGIRWDTVAGSGSTIWVPMTNGDPDAPEILFDDDGQVLMEEIPL